jgi:hypothetical protein
VHPLEKEIDEEMFQHIIYALNKVLLILRDGDGINEYTIKKGGKVLFRLSTLVRAYVHKKSKENIPAEEFAKRLLELVNRLNGDFLGVPNPLAGVF